MTTLTSRDLRTISLLTKLALAGGSGTDVRLNHHCTGPFLVRCDLPSKDDWIISEGRMSVVCIVNETAFLLN